MEKTFCDEKICQKCKTTEGNFIKISRSSWKQVYYCRKCNKKKHDTYIKKIGDKYLEYNKKSYYKNYEKSLARSKVNNAVASKKIVKPLECQFCRGIKKLEAHHKDYSSPLKIIWLCQECHCEADRKLKNKK